MEDSWYKEMESTGTKTRNCWSVTSCAKYTGKRHRRNPTKQGDLPKCIYCEEAYTPSYTEHTYEALACTLRTAVSMKNMKLKERSY